MPRLSTRLRGALSACSRAKTNVQKGRHFERSAKILLKAVSGLEFYASNVLNDGGSIEIDLIFINNRTQRGFSELDPVLLAECKNWNSGVDAKAIRDFVGKLDRKKRNHGFLFTANGITGNAAQQTAAHDEIRQTFVDKGKYIIVVSAAEMKKVGSGLAFVRLTRRKIAEIIARA